MNKKRVLKLANFIENREIKSLGFNMMYYVSEINPENDNSGHGCGTAACIAGWCYAMMTSLKKLTEEYGTNDIKWCSSSYLELTLNETFELFLPMGRRIPLGDITPEHAVATLRHFAETGKVDWNINYAA